MLWALTVFSEGSSALDPASTSGFHVSRTDSMLMFGLRVLAPHRLNICEPLYSIWKWLAFHVMLVPFSFVTGGPRWMARFPGCCTGLMYGLDFFLALFETKPSMPFEEFCLYTESPASILFPKSASQ